MPGALSLDLRERVIAAVRAGSSCRQAAERFEVEVGPATAIRWQAPFRTDGEAGRPSRWAETSGRRALLGVLQALRHTQLTDPSKEVVDRAPRPRTIRHAFASALHLAKTARRRGCRGLACISIACWDTAFQLGDAMARASLREQVRHADQARVRGRRKGNSR